MIAIWRTSALADARHFFRARCRVTRTLEITIAPRISSPSRPSLLRRSSTRKASCIGPTLPLLGSSLAVPRSEFNAAQSLGSELTLTLRADTVKPFRTVPWPSSWTRTAPKHFIAEVRRSPCSVAGPTASRVSSSARSSFSRAPSSDCLEYARLDRPHYSRAPVS